MSSSASLIHSAHCNASEPPATGTGTPSATAMSVVVTVTGHHRPSPGAPTGPRLPGRSGGGSLGGGLGRRRLRRRLLLRLDGRVVAGGDQARGLLVSDTHPDAGRRDEIHQFATASLTVAKPSRSMTAQPY